MVIFENDQHMIKVSHEQPANDNDQFLFNNSQFIQHQNHVKNTKSLFFSLYNKENDTLMGLIDFSSTQHDNVWITPVTGAFGALFIKRTAGFAEVELLLNSIRDYLFDKEGARQIVWRIPPLYFDRNVTNKVFNVLNRQGWQVKSAELNFHINIDRKDDFHSRLTSGNVRKIKKLTQKDVVFSLANDEQACKTVYDVINKNRLTQGYPMTMDWPSLLALRNVVGDKVIFAGLYRKSVILAGAICLRISPDTLYAFYWGEDPAFRNESPVTKIAEQLYLMAAEEGYTFLDMGISTDSGIPNYGLALFKERLGGEISQKFIMSCENKKI